MSRSLPSLFASGALAAALLVSTPEAGAQGRPFVAPPPACDDSPFVAAVALQVMPGQNQEVADFIPQVPEGKRFIVRYINGRGTVPDGQFIRFIVFAGGSQFHFAPDVVGLDVTHDQFVLSEPVFFTANRNPDLSLNATRASSTSGEADVRVRLSGCLIDLPDPE